MTKLDKTLIKAQCAVTANCTPETLKRRSKYARVGFIIMSCMSILMMMSAVCFAADTATIEGKIGAGMKEVYTVICGIVVPIAVIALGFAGFQFFFGGEKGVEKAKKTLVYTVIGVGLILLAPLIVSQVSKWFTGGNNNNNVWNGTIPG